MKKEEGEEKEKKVKKLTVDEKIAKANETLRLCYSQLPNYELLVNHLIKYGIDALPEHCTLTPGALFLFYFSFFSFFLHLPPFSFLRRFL